MTLSRLGLWAAVPLLALGCAKASPEQDPASIDTNLAQYVLDEVPGDLKNPTFIDFEGRVQIIGWDLEPKGVVGPGQQMRLTLSWKTTGQLGKGWSLFTHLVAPGGVRKDSNVNGVALDDLGPLRTRNGPGASQALPPSAWRPGKIYVDVQDIAMPRDLTAPEVSIVVGVWKGQTRLDVISGSADRERRAIITNVRTGVVPTPRAKRADRPQQKS